jgi:iron complex transport system substrate-binding protein
MRRTITALATAFVALTFAAGCGSTSDTPGPSNTNAGYPVTVGSVTLDKQPQKIVSLAPSLTEMVFAIGAGQQVVAVDEYSNYPADAPKTDLSGYKPNAESIAKYSPDLVVISDDSENIVDQLKALSIPTYVAPAANTLDDTYKEITELGALTGHSADAAALVGQMKADLEQLVKDLPNRSKPLTYYYELDNTYYSVTSKTFIGALFTAAGLVNIADAGNDTNAYPQLSAETIIKANPDLIFLADTKCCGQSATTVAARPGWDGLTAVKNGGVIALDDDIASRWGPRVVDLQRIIVEAAAKAPAS